MSKTKYSAIVTDGLWRKSLSAIRSLGKAEFEVSVMGDSVFTTGFWSRYTSKKILAPTAALNPNAFGEKLVLALEEQNKRGLQPVLFPMEDASLMWTAENIEKIKINAAILLPPKEALYIAQDKGKTMQTALKMGIPCPKTWQCDNLEDFINVVNGLETGSFIVKPITGSGSSGIIHGEMLQRNEWENHWGKYGKLIIQERIPIEGKGIGVAVLMNEKGKCKAFFAHKRLREYPVSGGPSTDRISFYNMDLIEKSIKLLKSLSWQGIAMIEWKEDIRDGLPKIMEINPRFWGSLELAVRAGVDFPVLYAKAALGEEFEDVFDYKEGIRCRWMIPGEILRYLSQSKEEREKLGNFLKGLPSEAEEWDKADLAGTLGAVACPAFLALNPRYWKYIRRRNSR
ncbi:MAG: ATP-grasp domain-containing protein [Deltaproteobacteria bacterium]